ncbi:MAG: PaaI family thioesterase [Candidatus Sulfotelmatobacter sp.]
MPRFLSDLCATSRPLRLGAFGPDRAKIIPMPSKSHGHDTRYMKLQKNYCFVCGMDNPDGMRLKFILDEARQTFVCRFHLSKRYTGPPGHCHGGVIACILDDAMGKVC